MSEVSGGSPPADLLLEHARQAARTQGFSLEVSFEGAFLEAIGANWQVPGHTLDEAKINTNLLITKAINFAGPTGKKSLDRNIFNSVLAIKGFCPLWPFC